MDKTGFEPELGGILRQNSVYVDEATCIGCGHCAYVARNTFFLEEDYGRARVINQTGDSIGLIQEAIDTCPVDCIAWVNEQELIRLEELRKYQVISSIGLVGDGARTDRRSKMAS